MLTELSIIVNNYWYFYWVLMNHLQCTLIYKKHHTHYNCVRLTIRNTTSVSTFTTRAAFKRVANFCTPPQEERVKPQNYFQGIRLSRKWVRLAKGTNIKRTFFSWIGITIHRPGARTKQALCIQRAPSATKFQPRCIKYKKFSCVCMRSLSTNTQYFSHTPRGCFEISTARSRLCKSRGRRRAEQTNEQPEISVLRGGC